MTHRLFALFLRSAAWFGVPLGLTIAAAALLSGHQTILAQISEIPGLVSVLRMLVPPDLLAAVTIWCSIAPAACLGFIEALSRPSVQAAIALLCIVAPSVCVGLAGIALDRRGREVSSSRVSGATIQRLRVAGACLVTSVAFAAIWGWPSVLMALHLGWMPRPEPSLGATTLLYLATVPIIAMAAGARLGLGLIRLSNLTAGASATHSTGRRDGAHDGFVDPTVREPRRNPVDHRPVAATNSKPI